MSQRRQLLALLFAVSTPMLVLAALFVVTSVRDARARAEDDAASLARAGAVAAGSFIDGNMRALQATAAGVRHASGISVDALREELRLRMEVNEDWDGMSVVDHRGIVLAGSREDSTGVDLSGRAYLQQVFATGRPAVSDGVLTIGQGVPSILIAAPVYFDDGTMGAVVGQLTLRTLAGALTSSLTVDARVGLIDRSGQTLVHADPARSAVLANVADRPEVQAGWAGATGTIEVERAGTRVLVAHAPLSDLGWVVTVSQDSSAAFANANDIATRGMLLLAIAVLAVLVGGWYLGGRLSRSYAALQESRARESEARQRAEAALRSRDEFISIASHELRNPVAAIRGFGQLMQRRIARGTLEGSDLREYVDSIVSSGAYLSRLVEDLLSVSRLEGGRLDLRLTEMDVMEVIHRASVEAPIDGHPLRVTPPPSPVVTTLDADRVTQILVNLLENAAKYSPAGGEIAVTVFVADGQAHLAVRDAGIGLPSQELARLFAPFGRATNARDANIPGLGLGLYVSRRLAEAHGGTLTAASEGEGRGSTFTLVLPIVVAATDGNGAAPPVGGQTELPVSVEVAAGEGATA
ncbi:MAG: ATP-binding protein [Dehalococcoidia bacterium]